MSLQKLRREPPQIWSFPYFSARYQRQKRQPVVMADFALGPPGRRTDCGNGNRRNRPRNHSRNCNLASGPEGPRARQLLRIAATVQARERGSTVWEPGSTALFSSQRAARRWSTFAATSSAEAARPASRHNVIRLRCRSSRALATTFVRMSAGLSSPGTLCSVKLPARSRSWTQSWLTARWRTRPMPALRQMPMAADESAWMLNRSTTPRSAARLCKPQPSLAPRTTPASSASKPTAGQPDFRASGTRL